MSGEAEERGYESDRTPEGRLAGMARDIELGLTPVLAWPTQFENPKSMTAVETAKDIRSVLGELKGLREAAKLACDLLAERVYGSPARSPGHNARLKLEAALSSAEQVEREGSRDAALNPPLSSGGGVVSIPPITDEQRAYVARKLKRDPVDLSTVIGGPKAKVSAPPPPSSEEDGKYSSRDLSRSDVEQDGIEVTS